MAAVERSHFIQCSASHCELTLSGETTSCAKDPAEAWPALKREIASGTAPPRNDKVGTPSLFACYCEPSIARRSNNKRGQAEQLCRIACAETMTAQVRYAQSVECGSHTAAYHEGAGRRQWNVRTPYHAPLVVASRLRRRSNPPRAREEPAEALLFTTR